MSEYQYYEWQTLDRPLTPEERAAVNGLSSHIDVTSTRAVVTYHWSDFKHDPLQVLARYFDAFLYMANWGSKRLAFRFPKGLLIPAQIEPYLWEYRIEMNPVGDHLILDISLDEEEGGDWIEGEGWLSSLSRLRDDILEGDYRALYLAWLRAAEMEDADDDELEPPVPPGLGLVRFGWKGAFSVDGVEIVLSGYPRYANPYVQAEFDPTEVKVSVGGHHWRVP